MTENENQASHGYKEFKGTEIGRIPKEWEVVRLEDISEDIYYGITAKATEKDTGIKILRTTDVKDYNVKWDSLPFCEITEERRDLSKYFLKKNDVIVARAGTTGVSVLVDRDLENVIFGSYLIKVKLKHSTHPKFIHYFLQSDFYWKHITSSQSGSTLKNINLPILKSLKIPLPPLPEQRKIAEILSKVDEAIQKVDEAIARTERLKRGLMQELLTKGIGHREFKDTEIGRIPKEWEVVRLGDVSLDFVGGGTPSTSNPEYWGGNIPWMTSAHISGRLITTGQRYITEKGLKESATNIVPRENILVGTRVGIGKVAINLIDIAISQDLTGIIIKKDMVFPEFVYWALINNESKLKSLAQGSTIRGILREDLAKILIPLPPLPEQRRIAEILSTVDNKIEFERKRKEKLQRIKQGLMNVLLTGKKRVNIQR